MERQDSRCFVSPFEKLAVLKAYKCSSCNRIYSTQVYANSVTGRIPLLMPCSHTICEECLSHMAKTKNICCKVCQYAVILESLDALANYFPVDRFMFGSLMNLNIEVLKRSNAEKKHTVLPFKPAGASVKPAKILQRGQYIKDISPDKEVELCSQTGCSKRAEFRCINCTELYCAKCDKRVHESIKILRHHNRYPIGIADLADYNVSCVTHSDSVGEYSCLTCGTMLCSKCVIKNHTAHEVIAIEDKNAQELEDFKEALRKGKTVLKSMEFTQKKVKLEINSTRQNLKPSHLEFEIIKHFAALHSRLQLLEHSMLEQFAKAQVAKVDSLNRLSSELTANIEIMHSLVATGNMVVEGGNAHLDKLLLSELQKNITENLILPCELIEENGNGNGDGDGNGKKEDTIQFITDDSFMDSLQNHCQIKFEEGLSFKLTPMTDFSERKFDMGSEDNSTIDSSDNESVRSRNESESSGTSQISYLKPGCKTRLSLAGSIPTLYGGQDRKREKPKHPNEPIVFVKDTIETVKVTHLTNPSNFYVQLSRKKKEIEELTNKYEIYAEHAATPTQPEIGNTYIVKFTSASNANNWYRATVKDILATGLTPLYEVFYIDYGNSALVPISKIRIMKPIFMQDAPFAYKCRLNGIISQRNEWSDEVLTYMLKFITALKDPPLHPAQLDDFMMYENRNNTLKMHVIQNQKGILDVDLYANNESLSAGLIFVGFAQPMTHLFEKKRRALNNEFKIVSAIDSYEKDKIYSIHATHVENPHCIFVQRFDNEKIIKNLETAMTRFYDKKDQRRSIFTPEKGMICVARLPCSNNNWWRVEIVNLPGGATVEVFALDYGNTVTVPWNSLCKIRDIHRQTDAQAIKVSLSDIAPPKNSQNEWPESTNKFLQDYLKNKNLSMYVNETTKEKLLITLYEHTEETDICIDALLVRKCFAESTNESSLLVEFHRNLPGEEEPETRNDFEQIVKELKPKNFEKDSRQDMFGGKHYIVDVKVLKLESPSSFYIEVIRWSDEKLKMVTRMAKHYTELVSPAKKWELKAKCVVRSDKDDRYYRAIITKVLEDDCYEVFLKDFIRYEEVPTRNLYELNELFATHDYTVHCRLGGLKPTGGSEKWPSQATELFQEFLDQYSRICISKYGPIVENVLSVQLFTMWDEKVGPLDPLKVNTLVLNDILLCSGLAIPDKVSINDCVIKGTVTPSLTQLTKCNINPAMSDLPNNIFGEGEYDGSVAPPSKLIEETKQVHLSVAHIQPPTILSWLPPARFTEKRFKAWASYVDTDGSVYLQTLKAQRMLKNITRLLDNHFKSSQSNPGDNWEVGQMCTCIYHQDNTYCRATIINILGEKIVVRLTDYGNQEEMTHEELRKEVLATDIPALAVRCRLSNVVPKSNDESWSTHLLDRLHFTLVEKECEVVLDESDGSGDDVPHVLIFMENECINNLCNTAEWSKTMPKLIPKPPDSDDEKDVVIEDEISNEDIDIDIADVSVEDISQTHDDHFNYDSGYNYVQLPNNQKSFGAIVVNIIDYRTIIIEPEFAASVMTSTSDQFDAMSTEIATCGVEQPEVLAPSVGMPCIALFGSDEKWYRALILAIMDIQAREIKVLFVDYGNLEVVPREDVRALNPEWLQFPVSMITVKIWGILQHPDFDMMEVNAAMKKVIVDKKVICQIQSNISDMEVKLIDEETYELAYKVLIDSEMIQSIN